MNVLRILCAVAIACMLRPAMAQTVTTADLEERDGLWYEVGSDAPYSGQVEDPGELAGRVEAGQRVGRWTAWQDNGEISWVDEYDQGQRNYHAMYYPNGTMRFEADFQDGRPHGVTNQWYDSGVQRSVTYYASGQRHGSHQLWDPDGHLLYEAEYIGGALDGAATWWYNNGQKRWATYYDAGERSGIWTQWSREGNILGQSEWEGGKMTSRTKPSMH